MKNDFESFYNSINQDEMRIHWEEARKEKKRKTKIAIILILIIDLTIIWIVSRQIGGFNTSEFGIFPWIAMFIPIIVIDIIIFAITSLIFSKNTIKYNNVFKEKVINSIFENFLYNVDYIPKKQMPQDIYKEGKYDEYYNRYYSDDYLDATIDDKYNMKMAEVTTEYVETKTDSDGDTHTETTTIFSGLFAKINIGKSINSELRIKQNGTLFKKNRLEMDSQEFEKYFDVISTNQIIGMQLLTHDIMDILVDFRIQLKMPLDILIREDIMYIRLHTGKMFETTINNKSILDRKTIEKYFNIVNFIYSLSKKMIKVVEETQI